MRAFFFLCLATISLAVGSCRGKQSIEDGDRQDERSDSEFPHRLVAAFEPLRLRETPGEKGRVTVELRPGTILYDQGEVSDFTTRIILRGRQFDEPWLKVVDEDGREGWIYGGSINLETGDSPQLENFLRQKKLQSLFGKGMLQRLPAYREAFENISTADELSAVYEEGENLRDTLVELLAEKTTGESPPDFFWIQQFFPGFAAQLVAEGTQYYFFADYRRFLDKARQTPGNVDDDFFEICIAAFPHDSLEFFFPGWTIQTTDYSGHSLLGRGLHHELLQRLDRFSAKSNLFAGRVKRFKTDLVNDITGQGVTFWESREKILAEVDSILAGGYRILSNDDIIALQTRRKHFENPEEYGIEMNHQAGIY
jgi:hypothetical protein